MFQRHRHDQTDWLIHFVRDRASDQDPSDEEDAFRLGEEELAWDASAFDVLRTIIRLGALIPGHSIRNGKTTLYGGQPVVCATEMPVYSFAKQASKDKSNSNCSAYGVAFLKSDFYAAGGRPAIYGLSVPAKLTHNAARRRLLHESCLPLHEQYRYVAYNPAGNRLLDWTHEREWRWKAAGKRNQRIFCSNHFGLFDETDALPLFLDPSDGGHFSQLVFLVWTAEESERLKTDLSGFWLAGGNDYGSGFSRKLLARSKLVVLEKVISAVEKGKLTASQTIEGLDRSQFLESIDVFQPDRILQSQIRQILNMASREKSRVAAAYVDAHPHESFICGYAQVTTEELRNPNVQQLVHMGLASGPYDGRLVIKVPATTPNRQDLTYNEAVCRAAADILNSQLGPWFLVDTRLD